MLIIEFSLSSIWWRPLLQYSDDWAAHASLQIHLFQIFIIMLSPSSLFTYKKATLTDSIDHQWDIESVLFIVINIIIVYLTSQATRGQLWFDKIPILTNKGKDNVQ